MPVRRRSRLRLSVLALATVAAGLATRRFPEALPDVLVAFGGDVLWAALVYWLLAWLMPSAAARRLAVLAGGISLLVECSQLLTPAWLVALRANWLGALVLGQGFLWSDLACYAAGVVLAWWLDARGAAGMRA